VPQPADLVWRNATILDASGVRPAMDIVVRAGVISQVVSTGTDNHLSNQVVDCHGRVLIPAFANVHHHFYAAFLRGAPGLKVPPRDQRERLEHLVWPYEKTLDRDDVRVAVRFGLLEAVVAGTTMVVDHHVSAGCVDGILNVIAEEISAAGVRAVLCYEITDRDGERIARAGLRETERFLSTVDSYRGQIQAMVGLHAMSTVGPNSLAEAVAIAERHGVGIHLHVGEAIHDNDLSVARYGDRPLARLEQARGLNSQSLLAHAVHVTHDEMLLLARRDVMVAHNPRSNASNGVGTADLAALKEAEITVGIGGDGFTQDIWSELPLMTLLQRQRFHSPLAVPPDSALDVGLKGNAAIIDRLSGWKVGRIEPSCEADVIMLDGEPTIPITPHNARWHLANGVPGLRVRDVFTSAQPVLTAGRPTTIDEERVRHDMRLRFPVIWERLAAIP
jgi:cytosine/adenosine deaminase-related metal-dependent hydrolase